MGTDRRTVDETETSEGAPVVDDVGGMPRSRQAVFEDLTATLQTLRGGVHAADMAAALLRYAGGSTALVALVDGGQRAVCYCANARTLAAVPFDRHGVDPDDADRARRSLRDPTTWVDAADPDWVHPRYRRGAGRDYPGRRAGP